MTSVDQAATGWRLVPVEATEGMVKAGVKCAQNNHTDFVQDAYRAMLSAAPQPGVTAEDIARVISATARIGLVPISPDHVRSGLINADEVAQAVLSLISSNPTQKEQGE